MAGPLPAGRSAGAPAPRGRCRRPPSPSRACRSTDDGRPGRGDPLPSRISSRTHRGDSGRGEPFRPCGERSATGGAPARGGRSSGHAPRLGRRPRPGRGTSGRAFRRPGARGRYEAGPGTERHRGRGRLGRTETPCAPDRGAPRRCAGHHGSRRPGRARGEGAAFHPDAGEAGAFPSARCRTPGRRGTGARAVGTRHARHVGRARGRGPPARCIEPSEGGRRGGAPSVGPRPGRGRPVHVRTTGDRLLRRRLRAARGSRPDRPRAGSARRPIGGRHAARHRPRRSRTGCLAPVQGTRGPYASRRLGPVRRPTRRLPEQGFAQCESVPCVSVADGVTDSRILHVILK